MRHAYRRHHPCESPADFIDAGEMPEAGILRELEEKTALSAEVTNVLSVGSLTQRHLEVALLGSTDSGQTPSFNHEIFDSAFAIPMDLPEGMLLGRKDLVGHAASRLNSN